MKDKLNCILLVDDNNFTNIYNKRFLAKISAAEHIHAVKDGKEALNYLNQEGEFETDNGKYPKPDLIFLDINMPIMDGWDFLYEFNKVKPKIDRDIVIVMLTTSPNPDDKRKATSIVDVHGFYRKPITEKMIREIMQQYFD